MKTLIEMAREAGFDMPQGESFYQAWPEEIERFAELVRADEREAAEERVVNLFITATIQARNNT